MAWGVRQLGAAQALGAPKGVGHGPLGVGAKPGQKPGTKLPMAPQKNNPAPKHNANPHHGVPGQGQHAHPGPTGGGESLPLVQLSQPQLQHRALKLAQAQGRQELAPLQNQARELSATEQAAQNRFKGYAETQQANLASLGQQAEASAKTAQNQAADNALKAGQAIETSGQAQAGLTGGYLSPELRAELQAEGQRAAGTGAAGKSLAEQSGQNEINLLGNMRAAAVAKATEGSSQIASQYGRALRENATKQGEIPGRVSNNVGKLATELEGKQFNQKATEAGLGIKTTTLAQKAKETAAKLRTTERGQNFGRMNAQEKARVTREVSKERTASSERGHSIAERHYAAADATARERARTAAEKSNPGGVTPDAALKQAEQLGSAFTTIRQLREQKLTPAQIRNVLSTGYLRANVKEGGKTKTTTLKYSKVANQALVQAAFELWDTHKVSGQTAAQLKALGLTAPAKSYVGLTDQPTRRPANIGSRRNG